MTEREYDGAAIASRGDGVDRRAPPETLARTLDRAVGRIEIHADEDCWDGGPGCFSADRQIGLSGY